MTYSITWTGVEGPTRRTDLSAAEVVSWHKSYDRISTDFVIEDETGSRVAIEDVRRLMKEDA